jgi:hypothetical protein
MSVKTLKEKLPNAKRSGLSFTMSKKTKRFFELHATGINYFGKYNEKTQRGGEYKGCIDLLHSTEIMRAGSTLTIINGASLSRVLSPSSSLSTPVATVHPVMHSDITLCILSRC